MFSFSHRECIILQKGSVGHKMSLNSIFQRCFSVLKDFDQSSESIAINYLQFYMFLMGFCVIRKLLRKQEESLHAS